MPPEIELTHRPKSSCCRFNALNPGPVVELKRQHCSFNTIKRKSLQCGNANLEIEQRRSSDYSPLELKSHTQRLVHCRFSRGDNSFGEVGVFHSLRAKPFTTASSRDISRTPAHASATSLSETRGTTGELTTSALMGEAVAGRPATMASKAAVLRSNFYAPLASAVSTCLDYGSHHICCPDVADEEKKEG
jgi:hypothetical protein